jgi:hypothetical protein
MPKIIMSVPSKPRFQLIGEGVSQIGVYGNPNAPKFPEHGEAAQFHKNLVRVNGRKVLL